MDTVDDAREEDGRPFRRRPGAAIGEFTLSVAEAAERIGVSEYTVRHWIRKNQIPARRLPGTKPWKLRPGDVEEIIGNPVTNPGDRPLSPTPTADSPAASVESDLSDRILADVAGESATEDDLDVAAMIVASPVAVS